jgi:hypothetical protein
MALMLLGISLGLVYSAALGWVYLGLLREPGSAFYPFAGLIFLGGPLLSGAVAAAKTRGRRLPACLISGAAVFGVAFALFVGAYVVQPQFVRANVQLPAGCDGFAGSFDPPADLAYTLPGLGTGILLASDAQTAVVVVMDYQHPPYPSTVLLVDRSDNQVRQKMHFGDNLVIATIDEGVLYLYNDKLGYVLDAHTGAFEENFLLIDNYGGLTQSDRPFLSRASDGHLYMETTAVISSWRVDGTVLPHRYLTFNALAFNCFISGSDRTVTQL